MCANHETLGKFLLDFFTDKQTVKNYIKDTNATLNDYKISDEYLDRMVNLEQIGTVISEAVWERLVECDIT